MYELKLTPIDAKQIRPWVFKIQQKIKDNKVCLHVDVGIAVVRWI